MVFSRGDYPICCYKAVEQEAYLDKNIPQPDYKCGQTYSSNLAPAPNLQVEYGWCKNNCDGWGEKGPTIPAEKLAPLLQYTLPAVVFSMTVPRRMKMEIPSWFFAFQITDISMVPRALLSLFVGAFIVVSDTLIWVIWIFAGAGPMLFSGLLEALVDYRIITHLHLVGRGRPQPRPNAREEEIVERRKEVAKEKVEIISALICGNIDRDFRQPQLEIKQMLVHDLDDQTIDKATARLLAMMSAQPSFGSSVGGAVLFYVGSFIYTIFDIKNKKGDTDTADALAFGLWWMTIVHVSIIAGCLLASNNPSTAATLAGLSSTGQKLEATMGIKGTKILGLDPILTLAYKPCYPSIFQPVWMWQRGDQKMRWVRGTGAWRDVTQSAFRDKIHPGWLAWILLTIVAFLLVFIPALLAFLVEYLSPKIGLGCRSLTVSMYVCSQTVLIIFTLLENIRPANLKGYCGRRREPNIPITRKDKMWLASIWFLAFPTMIAGIVAVFVTLGGTLMEVMGVYDSCICGITATAWFPTSSRDAAVMFLASDTVGFRNSARLWGWCGFTAIIFMSVMCYLGYWYQRYLREKFMEAVNHIKTNLTSPKPKPKQTPTPPTTTATTTTTNTGENTPQVTTIPVISAPSSPTSAGVLLLAASLSQITSRSSPLLPNRLSGYVPLAGYPPFDVDFSEVWQEGASMPSAVDPE
jgi:hypothetical protein